MSPTTASQSPALPPRLFSGLTLREIEQIPVQVSHRTVWLCVRLHTDQGVSGLGEASLGMTTRLPELDTAFELARALPHLSIPAYRARSREFGARNLRCATAVSAVEMALWDIAGRAQGAPIHELLGGQVRTEIGLYANINRMTTERVPAGFAASAVLAAEAGFTAFKAAPFDNFPVGGSADEVRDAEESGIDALFAMRSALPGDAAIKVDCHSFFDVTQAVRIARSLEEAALDWYEEPVPVEQIDDTRHINAAIKQRMAGGELMFGTYGFRELCATDQPHAVDVIMPDVMHCGGISEALHIAAIAADAHVEVSPHNAVGPIATAASAQVCALASNVESLELQWGEVPWRETLLTPPLAITDGRLAIPSGPGLGIEIDERALRAANQGR